MHVPTFDDYMQTFSNIVTACIVEKGQQPDFGSVNVKEDAKRNVPNFVEDKYKTVY